MKEVDLSIQYIEHRYAACSAYCSSVINRLALYRKSAIRSREDYIKEHQGHEEMHLTMVIIFLVAVFCGQLFLVCWKTRHSRSYQASVNPFVFFYN